MPALFAAMPHIRLQRARLQDAEAASRSAAGGWFTALN
jgi:hypothetical protein